MFETESIVSGVTLLMLLSLCVCTGAGAVVGGDEEDGYDARNEEALWEWWHSVLVSCVVVVVVLVAIVMALLLVSFVE